jgi:hypothetical protein
VDSILARQVEAEKWLSWGILAADVDLALTANAEETAFSLYMILNEKAKQCQEASP